MIGLVVLALLTAPPAARGKNVETLAAMHSALHALVGVQPYLASAAAFRDPANAAAITSDLDALSGVQHRFMKPGRQDPALATLAGIFGSQVELARADFKTGNTEATRGRLRGLTSLCFACHSRQTVAKDFEDTAQVIEALQLSPLRRAELFATTRQFDLAIAAWKQVLDTMPLTEADAFDHAAAMREYLSVLVRVKDDRASTVAAIGRQLARTDLPVFSRRLLEQWSADAKAWQADPFAAATATPAALVTKSRALIDTAEAAKSSLPDERRFIATLGVTAYLHAALEKEPMAIWRGEALYLLGVASTASFDPLLWDLDTLYLEACIREKPHSAIALQCSARMDDRAWFGWTGSGGTRIPADVAARLTQLRQLAQ